MRADRTLLQKADAENYRGVVQDMVDAGTIDTATLTSIRQIFTADHKYLGALLFVDGPTRPSTSGPEPAYRYHVYVDPEWNEERFDSALEFYTTIRKRTKGAIRIASFFLARDDQFEHNGTMTLQALA